MMRGFVVTLIFALSLYASERVYSIQLLTSNGSAAVAKVYRKLPKSIKDRSVIYVTDSGKYTIRYLLSKRATPLKKVAKELKIEGLKTRFWVVNTDPKKAKKLFLQKYGMFYEKGMESEAKEIGSILKRVFPGIELPSLQKKKMESKKGAATQKRVKKSESEKKSLSKESKPVHEAKVERVEKGEKGVVRKESDKGFVPEPWMLLNSALHQYDLQKIERIVKEHKGLLPHRDEVDALSKLQRYSEAKEDVFAYLQKFRYDYHLYKQFLDLISMDSSRVDAEVKYIDRGVIGYIDSTLDYKHELTQKRYLLIGVKSAAIGSFDRAYLKSLPDTLNNFSLGYKEILEDGYYKIVGGVKGYYETFWNLQLEYYDRATDRWENSFKVAIGEDALESAALLLAGKKDLLEMESIYRVNRKTAFRANISLSSYSDQDGKSVGDGRGISLLATKKFRVSYPDFSARAYILRNSYNLKDNGWGLFQNISVESPPFLLPSSYTQAGAGLFFGYDHKYLYTRRWRPFVDLELFSNTATKGGFSAVLGIGGPLFHKDNFSVTATYSSDFEGTGQNYSEISLYYFYLF